MRREIVDQRVAAATGARRRSAESRFVLYDVPWHTYVTLRDTLDDQTGLRVTYLEGTLELMRPSADHEEYKKLLARLVEAYAEEQDLDLRGYGGATFRQEAVKRGLEPDECYWLGRIGSRPDIAIEVVVSSGLVDKLDVYAGLEVPEVWVYADGKLTVHRLVDGAYRVQTASSVLPELDVNHLAGFVVPDENQTRLVKAYRASLRARGKKRRGSKR
jgi:Uma2 family endonuclease